MQQQTIRDNNFRQKFYYFLHNLFLNIKLFIVFLLEKKNLNKVMSMIIRIILLINIEIKKSCFKLIKKIKNSNE